MKSVLQNAKLDWLLVLTINNSVYLIDKWYYLLAEIHNDQDLKFIE